MLLNDNAVSPAEASQQSALTLAYLGDAVYELLVREKLVIHSHKTNGKLHFEATRFVSAKAQSEFVEKILGTLTPEELSVYKRGEIPMPFRRRIPMSPFTSARRVLKRFSGICIFREGRKE